MKTQMEEAVFAVEAAQQAVREAYTHACHEKHSSWAMLSEINTDAQALLERVKSLGAAIADEPVVEPVCPVGFCRRIHNGTAIPNSTITIEETPDVPRA